MLPWPSPPLVSQQHTETIGRKSTMMPTVDGSGVTPQTTWGLPGDNLLRVVLLLSECIILILVDTKLESFSPGSWP